MTETRPPFRAEVVGSLLRPAAIHEARARNLDPVDLRAIEERYVREAVARQKEVGLRVATDGEFHRRHWFLDFLERIDGVEVHGGLPVKFHNEKGEVEFAPPRFEVTGKVRRSSGLSTPDFASLRPLAAEAGLIAKQPIPSPMCIHFRGGSAAISRKAYPDVEEFFADLAKVYREEIAELYAMGCRYLQIDDTNLPFLCDPKLRDNARAIGEDPERLPLLYVRMMNDAIASVPDDMVIGMHMCRGNHASSWVAEGGYDPVAEVVFGGINVDAFFLEYDSPRAGDFKPLRYLTGKKVAVLGLVTTKNGTLERKDDLKRRVDEAAKYLPLERLALSPQCGFASTLQGNSLTEEEQWAKLHLVVDTAEEIWRSR